MQLDNSQSPRKRRRTGEAVQQDYDLAGTYPAFVENWSSAWPFAPLAQSSSAETVLTRHQEFLKAYVNSGIRSTYEWAACWINGTVVINNERSISMPKAQPCHSCFQKGLVCWELSGVDKYLACLPKGGDVCCGWCVRYVEFELEELFDRLEKDASVVRSGEGECGPVYAATVPTRSSTKSSSSPKDGSTSRDRSADFVQDLPDSSSRKNKRRRSTNAAVVTPGNISIPPTTNKSPSRLHDKRDDEQNWDLQSPVSPHIPDFATLEDWQYQQSMPGTPTSGLQTTTC